MTLRVLHIVNDLRGGATGSLVSLLRSSAEHPGRLRHFVGYPACLSGEPDVFNGVAEDHAPLPIRLWSRQDFRSARQRLAWLKNQWDTRFGRKTWSDLSALVRRWQIDVVHTNSVVIADAAVFAAAEGIPHVWHIRERIGSGGFQQFPQSNDWVAEFISNQSVSIPVISRYVREFFERYGGREKTALVFDGIEVSKFRRGDSTEGAREFRRRFGIPENATVVAMVGGLGTAVKRHDRFIEYAHQIAATIPDVVFVIIGASPQSGRYSGPNKSQGYSKGIVDSVESSGFTDRVLFSGFVRDMTSAWMAVDIYVHLCEVEGFSRAILEAMAAAIPVVATDAGGNPEVVGDGETGLLVPAGDSRACIEAIRALIRSPRRCQEFGKNGRRKIEDQFSANRHYEIMAGVFEACA